jgi:hypothetical protein
MPNKTACQKGWVYSVLEADETGLDEHFPSQYPGLHPKMSVSQSFKAFSKKHEILICFLGFRQS